MASPSVTAWSFAAGDPGEVELSFPLGEEVRLSRSALIAAIYGDGAWAVRHEIEEASRDDFFSMASRIRVASVLSPVSVFSACRAFARDVVRKLAWDVLGEFDVSDSLRWKGWVGSNGFEYQKPARIIEQIASMSRQLQIEIELSNLYCVSCSSPIWSIAPKSPCHKWGRMEAKGLALALLAGALRNCIEERCLVCFAAGCNAAAYSRAALRAYQAGMIGDFFTFMEKLHDEEKTGVRAAFDFALIDKIQESNGRRKKGLS